MAIKVVINYPQTEEGMENLRNLQAEVIVRSLRRMLTKDQMNELVEKLSLMQANKEPLKRECK